MSPGEKFLGSFKGFLQEAGYSVVLAFHLRDYTQNSVSWTGDGLCYRMMVLPAGQAEGLNLETEFCI